MVTDDLIAGRIARLPDSAWSVLTAPIQLDLDLAPLEAAVDELIRTTEPYSPDLDAMAAELIHRHLPLSRRVAADPGVWRFLAVVVRPELVRHRFELRSISTMRTRFWSPGTRPDSNTFARLWWVAELSREGTDYWLTSRALASQSLANAIFVRTLSSYRPAVKACVQVLADAPADIVEETIRRLSRALATRPLEAHTHDELVALLVELEQGVVMDRDERRNAR